MSSSRVDEIWKQLKSSDSVAIRRGPAKGPTGSPTEASAEAKQAPSAVDVTPTGDCPTAKRGYFSSMGHAAKDPLALINAMNSGKQRQQQRAKAAPSAQRPPQWLRSLGLSLGSRGAREQGTPQPGAEAAAAGARAVGVEAQGESTKGAEQAELRGASQAAPVLGEETETAAPEGHGLAPRGVGAAAPLPHDTPAAPPAPSALSATAAPSAYLPSDSMHVDSPAAPPSSVPSTSGGHQGHRSGAEPPASDAPGTAQGAAGSPAAAAAAAALAAVKAATAHAVADSGKVEVQEVKDFAGEAVQVRRLVAPDSKAAQAAKRKAEMQAASSRGLDSLLAQLEKKKKLNILDKSRKDWGEYKDEKGVTQELEEYKKSGATYTEKVAFLSRADFREYEKERDLRMASRGPAIGKP